MIRTTISNSKRKILIGPLRGFKGGVNLHILNIGHNSAHKLVVYPDPRLFKISEYLGRYKRSFLKRVTSPPDMHGFDIVHTHVDPINPQFPLSGKKEFAWIHTFHTIYFEDDYPNGLQGWQITINDFLLRQAKDADLRISVSKWLKQHLESEYNIETVYVPNAFDSTACNRADSSRFIRKYGYDDFVLSLGGLSEIKNPRLFLEAASHLTDVKFVLAGCIEKQVNLKIPSNVILLPYLSHTEALDAISACSSFVMTSKREGLPTTLMEALYLKKSVVAPDIFGCAEVIREVGYGRLYRGDSIDSLAEQISFSIDDTPDQNQINAVDMKYSWKNIIKTIDTLYDSFK